MRAKPSAAPPRGFIAHFPGSTSHAELRQVNCGVAMTAEWLRHAIEDDPNTGAASCPMTPGETTSAWRSLAPSVTAIDAGWTSMPMKHVRDCAMIDLRE